MNKAEILESLRKLDRDEALTICENFEALSKFVLSYCDYLLNLAKQGKLPLSNTTLKQIEDMIKTVTTILDAVISFEQELSNRNINTVEFG